MARRIVLVGATGSGKSSTANLILDKQEFRSGLSPKSITKHCQEATCNIKGRTVKIVDTPGLFDTSMPAVEAMKELKNCLALTAPGPHAIILVMRIGHYMETETLKFFLDSFGDGVMDYTILLFTGLDALENDNVSLEQYLSEFPTFLKDIFRKYEYTAIDSSSLEHDSVLDLLEKINSVIEQNQESYYQNDEIESCWTRGNKLHTQDQEDVLNERMTRIVNILKSWIEKLEIISLIETILDHPVGKRTRSQKWLKEVEKHLNDNTVVDLLGHFPKEFQEMCDKENLCFKRKLPGNRSRERSPLSTNFSKRARHTIL